MAKQGNKSNKTTSSKPTHTNDLKSNRNRRLVHLAGFPGYLCVLISETTLIAILGSFLLSLFTDKNSNLLELSSTQTLITPIIPTSDDTGGIAGTIVTLIILSLLVVLGLWIILKGVRLSAQLMNDVVVTYAPKQHQFILKSLLATASLILACFFLLISYNPATSHTPFIGILTVILILTTASSFYLEHVLLERYKISSLSIWR